MNKKKRMIGNLLKSILSAGRTLLLFMLACAVLCGPLFPAWSGQAVAAEEKLTDGEEPEPLSPLLLNEAVSYSTGPAAADGVCYDWVEIKNISSRTILLDGYYLSDNKKELKKFSLPARALGPGELLLIWCTGAGTEKPKHQEELCAPFSISAEGETLYLSDGSGTVLDRLPVKDVPLYGSTGRMEGGEKEVFYFSDPTPGEENGTAGCREITEAPSASVPQGIYEDTDGILVKLTGSGSIYYTLDGSVPTEESLLYEGPFFLTETTVIRAVCLEKGKLLSSPASFSYILNEKDSLPVVSIVCDPHEMFDYDGVYHAARENKATVDADVTFFDRENGFSSLCSMELHGANSRKTYDKKSFELKFSSRYGGPVETDLFGTGETGSYRNLTLRGGALSRLELLRDVVAAELMQEVSPETYPLANRYAVAYINGEYYGIYSWREVYKEEYFEEHTGAAAEEVELTRAPPLQCEELTAIFNDIQSSSMEREENYERISEQIDLASLARWAAVQAYFNNLDISGNVRYVKRSPDAKWEVILYDLDYCCTSELDGQLGWTTVEDTYQIGYAVKALLRSPEFRQLLLEETAELCRNGFDTENILRIFEETVDALPREDVEKDCARWSDSPEKYDKNVSSMRKNLSGTRYWDWLQGLKKRTKADDETMKQYFPEWF